MASKYLKKYSVPEGFRDVLCNLVKEILRDQPFDLNDYCYQYFKALEEGTPFEYEKKGRFPIPPPKQKGMSDQADPEGEGPYQYDEGGYEGGYPNEGYGDAYEPGGYEGEEYGEEEGEGEEGEEEGEEEDAIMAGHNF